MKSYRVLKEEVLASLNEDPKYWDGQVMETTLERKVWVKETADRICDNLLPNQRVIMQVITEQGAVDQLTFIADMGSQLENGNAYATSKSTTPEEFETLYERFREVLTKEGINEHAQRVLISDAYSQHLHEQDEDL